VFDDIQRLHGVCREAPGGIDIPSLPVSKGEDEPYVQTATDDLKLVSDYAGMNFVEIMQLDCITFKMLLRDAFIHKMRQSDEGREYLKDCWLMTQTEPDRVTLRRDFSNA